MSSNKTVRECGREFGRVTRLMILIFSGIAGLAIASVGGLVLPAMAQAAALN